MPAVGLGLSRPGVVAEVDRLMFALWSNELLSNALEVRSSKFCWVALELLKTGLGGL